MSEIFVSIQGEGNYAGTRALFVRFQFCNLRCIWCDTKYTWYKNTGNYKYYTAEGLKKIIREEGVKHVIFTGGEPALFRLDLLVEPGFIYHVETNGTAIPDKPLAIALKDGDAIKREAMENEIISAFNWVVSPKLSNSRQKFDAGPIKYWAGNSSCIFKFICRSEGDLDEVETTARDFSIDKSRIYIGLEGITLDSQLMPLLVDKIIERGFNFSPRLQVILWGATRKK